jgi:hypothetical protein
MLDWSGLNYAAILVVWVINCAIGAFWYSPMGFAKTWHKYTGVNIMEIPQSEATKTLMAVVIAGLVQSVALAVLLNSLRSGTSSHPATDGFVVGLLIWLGFIAATSVGNIMYQRQGWRFWWLNSSYFLLVYLISSVILNIWP